MNIGENIKRYRKSKKMTQKELAEKLGLTASTVTKYENGNLKPDVKILINIKDILGINLSDIIGIESEIDSQTGDALNMLEELLYILDYVQDYEPSCSSDTVTVAYENITKEIDRSEFHSLQNEILEFMKFKINNLVSKKEPTY